MIDYEPHSWSSVLLRIRGTVLQGIALRLVAVAGVGLFAAGVHAQYGIKIPAIAHTLVGVALGLLLVFRTNASYDRYWEGRRLLGAITNRSRDLVRQLVSYVTPLGEEERVRVVRHVSLLYALVRQLLRRERELSALGPLVTADERVLLEPVTCRPTYAAAWISQSLARAAAEGRLSEQRLQLLDANLTAIVDAWGGAERIMKTPIPFAYAHHIKAFLVIFCATAPFAMVDAMGWHTPIAAVVLAFALLGIDEIGVEIEDPFGYDPNDLPLDRIGETIAGDTAALAKLAVPEATEVASRDRAS